MATPSDVSGPFKRGASTAPRSPAATRMTSSASGSRRANCCLALIAGGSCASGLPWLVAPGGRAIRFRLILV